MKTLPEKIQWYREPEGRKWKRVWHCVELSLIALSAIAVSLVMQVYGDGTKIQYPFIFLTLVVSLSAACLVPSVYQVSTFKRWQIQIIILGLGCSVGISALAAFGILELQHANI
ncbi:MULTISPECIES: hypothetical protein [unclassified Marinobacter]|uniref:hypothetical protein n=1 Tax=unclassified Marinobacter TaxID=83889 RepID=UPI0012692A38|nr:MULTISPECIES: hypothetical protein [unclassified Marinobacter]QFS87140.1 hypothetical protein FIV08_09880 [Marinobacter sp. THAF197a]QFS89049.1 hypothetical protein FIV08_19570 [Marinobacter sp. THAF197a]QFT50924.1 hypothetical protein FIU96_09800 [Marinobacter sp. THAF39]QFT52835.1 hypothetical protein FIU96_19480 [Marinobacter sp. THAF39]